MPIDRRETIRYGEKETAESAYISLSSFLPPAEDSKYRKGSDRNLERFVQAASAFRHKENIIVDIRGNGGGSTEYLENFFTRLYIKDFESYQDNSALKLYADLNQTILVFTESPAIAQSSFLWIKNFFSQKKSDVSFCRKMLMYQKKRPCKITYSDEVLYPQSREERQPLPETPFFSGRLIVIIDRNSASASEMFIQLAKRLFGSRCIVVGENSLGGLSYGNAMPYRLGQSKICINIPSLEITGSLRSIKNWQGEGYGMFPDVWTCGEDLLETLVCITGDEFLRDKIANIAWALQ